MDFNSMNRFIVFLLILFVTWCFLPVIVTVASTTESFSGEFSTGNFGLHEALFDQKLTLVEAQNIALQNSDSVESARRREDIASYRYQELRKKYFPDISLRVGAHKNKGDTEGRGGDANDNEVDDSTNYAELRASLPWGNKDGLLKDAESVVKDKAIAHVRYLDQVRDLQLSVHNLYFDLVLHGKLLSLAQEAHKIAEARLAKMQEKFALGTCSKIDLLAEESNVLSNLAAVESAQFNWDEKCRAFFSLLKVTPTTDFTLSDSLQFQSYERRDLDIDLIVSAKTSPQRLEVEKSEIALEKSRQRWFPKLSLYLGYQDKESDDDGVDTKGEYYGAVLEVPLPSRGGLAAMEAAKLKKVGAVKALSQAEESFRQGITSLEHQIKQMERIIRLDDQLLLAKKQEIALQRENFELGKISSIELNSVEATAVNAEQMYFKNVYKHMTVVAELETLIAQGEKQSTVSR